MCRYSGSKPTPRCEMPKSKDDFSSALEGLVRLYLINHKGFEQAFLGLKSNIDLVCGRSNEHHRPGEKYKKHPHQRRLTDDTIESIARSLAGIESMQFDDFEQLINYVRTPVIPYFKLTNSYDFAFRYGLNHGIVPRRYVYIHAGALRGAMHLRQLGYISFDPAVCKIAHLQFPPVLRRLPAFHLENFLCVMKKHLAGLPLAGSTNK